MEMEGSSLCGYSEGVDQCQKKGKFKLDGSFYCKTHYDELYDDLSVEPEIKKKDSENLSVKTQGSKGSRKCNKCGKMFSGSNGSKRYVEKNTCSDCIKPRTVLNEGSKDNEEKGEIKQNGAENYGLKMEIDGLKSTLMCLMDKIDRLTDENASLKSLTSTYSSSKNILVMDNKDGDRFLNGCYMFSMHGKEGMCNKCRDMTKHCDGNGIGDFCEKCNYCIGARNKIARTEMQIGSKMAAEYLKKTGKEGITAVTSFRFITVDLPNDLGNDFVLSVLGVFREKIIKSKQLKIVNHFGNIEFTVTGAPHLHMLVKFQVGNGVAKSILTKFLNTSITKAGGTPWVLDPHAIDIVTVGAPGSDNDVNHYRDYIKKGPFQLFGDQKIE